MCVQTADHVERSFSAVVCTNGVSHRPLAAATPARQTAPAITPGVRRARRTSRSLLHRAPIPPPLTALCHKPPSSQLPAAAHPILPLSPPRQLLFPASSQIPSQCCFAAHSTTTTTTAHPPRTRSTAPSTRHLMPQSRAHAPSSWHSHMRRGGPSPLASRKRSTKNA